MDCDSQFHLLKASINAPTLPGLFPCLSNSPVVKTGRGAIFSTYLRNWDLAVPGSPHRSTLISPLTLCFPPAATRQDKDKRWSSTQPLPPTALLVFTRVFGLPAKQCQGQSPLDVVMAKNRWTNAGNNLRKSVLNTSVTCNQTINGDFDSADWWDNHHSSTCLD